MYAREDITRLLVQVQEPLAADVSGAGVPPEKAEALLAIIWNSDELSALEKWDWAAGFCSF